MELLEKNNVRNDEINAVPARIGLLYGWIENIVKMNLLVVGAN